MKNILLAAINAKYIHSNPAVYSLRAYAEKYGQKAQIAEYTINQRMDFILEDIYRRSPDVLVFSCYIWNIVYVRELAREFHKLCPGVPVWAGGPEVSFETGEFLRAHPAFTGVMMGEGERTFSLLCRFYQEGGDLRGIPGIAWRNGDGEVVVQPQGEPLDLDEIPFCYRDPEDFQHRIIYYETSRGCPFSCSYCLSSVDKRLRFRSMDLIFEELQFFLDNRVPQVKFVDRTFNCNCAHALAVWRYISEHDNGITNFHFEIAADLLGGEELELLSGLRPGLLQFEIGVQTTNPETLVRIRRKADIEKLKGNVLRLKAGNNIHQHLDLIAGLPGEDYLSFQKSFNEIYALKPQQLQLGFLKVLKGSGLYTQAADYGILFRSQPPYEVLETNRLSYEDLLRIHLAEEMLEIHYNSGQFTTSLSCLEQAFDSAFSMYYEMGEFYRKRNLRGVSHSRLRRSEIFLEFALSVDGERKALYEEALTYDLYKREKCKSRPAWAADLSGYRQQTAAYLRKHGLERSYCHLEPFFAPRGSRKAAEPVWVLFDYEHRDALTGEAAVRKADLSDM